MSLKIFQINIVGDLSTGRIATDLCKALVNEKHEGILAYARNDAPAEVSTIHIGTDIDVAFHAVMTRLTDKAGFYSKRATKKLIKEIDQYQPNLIHLHNLHGYYLHIGLLFDYLKRTNIPVVWTLHDCWAFTGHCCYFDYIACNKWKTGCNKCSYHLFSYPKSLRDNSEWNYERKRELFTGLSNITLVTPSKWLASLVQESYLAEYPFYVIHNGIDTTVFKPTVGEWTSRLYLTKKIIVLGVASTWSEQKGFYDFIKLSAMLSESYQIVLVGLTDKQMKEIPDRILGLQRTSDMTTLAEIYTVASWFVNLTYEDNFPTVNLEALACGTPVITYRTGGSPEAIDDTCGRVVEKGKIQEIANIIEQEHFCSEDCIRRAQIFTKERAIKQYMNLYKEILA